MLHAELLEPFIGLLPAIAVVTGIFVLWLVMRAMHCRKSLNHRANRRRRNIAHL